MCMTVAYICCLNAGCIVVESSLEISACSPGAQSLVQAGTQPLPYNASHRLTTSK